jgi:hypothetical protein
MRAPHVVDLDRVAAEQIGQLVALIEAIDCDIAERGLRSRRSLLDLRPESLRPFGEMVGGVRCHAAIEGPMGGHVGRYWAGG